MAENFHKMLNACDFAFKNVFGQLKYVYSIAKRRHAPRLLIILARAKDEKSEVRKDCCSHWLTTRFQEPGVESREKKI
jgi:hypothetical protein